MNSYPTNATMSLPMTNTDTHSLCLHTGGRLVRLYSFDSYDAALIAFEAAVAYAQEHDGLSEMQARNRMAVRSLDDPSVQVVGWPAELVAPSRMIAQALAAAHRKEVSRTARWAIETARDGDTWNSITARMAESLNRRNMGTERWRLDDALKSRVGIGRAAEGRTAFFWKKGTKLGDVRNPQTGGYLHQTTLALQAPFYFIADPGSTVRERMQG